jgi:hypothetical protein
MIIPEAALPGLLTPWLVKVKRLIDSKIDDAAAHALKSITQRLKNTRDGRPTARKAVQSPSYLAAAARVEELRVALVGPTTASLSGLLRDARQAAFEQAFEIWRPILEPRWYRVDSMPTQEGINIARGAILHGTDLSREIAGSFEITKRGLFASVNTAGHSLTTAARADDLVELWRKQSTARIFAACSLAMGDVQLSLLYAVRHAMEITA